MAKDGITVTSNAESFRKELIKLEKQIADVKGWMKQGGMYMTRQVEGRFKGSGKNVAGADWLPILALSAAGRKVPPAGAKKKAAADRKVGKTTRATGASIIPLSAAQPLFPTRARQSSFEATADGVRIYPIRKIKGGGMSGLPVVLPHHPPSLTGHAGKNKMPDRSSFYLKVGTDDVYILKLGQREVDRELKGFAASTLRSAGAAARKI